MMGVITKYRRKQLAQITAGVINSIPKIKYIAIGDGAESSDGTIKNPSEVQTQLFHEVKRYADITVEIIDSTVKYTVIIPESDLKNIKINEMALVDETGSICAVKTFGNKVKDEHVKFTFQFADEY